MFGVFMCESVWLLGYVCVFGGMPIFQNMHIKKNYGKKGNFMSEIGMLVLKQSNCLLVGQ